MKDSCKRSAAVLPRGQDSSKKSRRTSENRLSRILVSGKIKHRALIERAAILRWVDPSVLGGHPPPCTRERGLQNKLQQSPPNYQLNQRKRYHENVKHMSCDDPAIDCRVDRAFRMRQEWRPDHHCLPPGRHMQKLCDGSGHGRKQSLTKALRFSKSNQSTIRIMAPLFTLIRSVCM
jgi:hypothetical protein